MVSFERGDGKDHEMVCATVYLSLGVTIELWSEEVRGIRKWDLNEVGFAPGDGRPMITLKPRGNLERILESEVITFVNREWDREVGREAKLAAGARGQEVLDVHC